MTSLDAYLAKATLAGPERTLPGSEAHYKTFGTESVDPASPRFDRPLSIDSCMWVASCTKLMTAIAALQCVEKGLLTLDDDISTVLPEWKKEDRTILRGFDEATGAPKLEAAQGKVSLRTLLTHSSGLGYAFMNESMHKYIKYKVANGWKIESELLCPDEPIPLLFEPGTSWAYGIGTDWAGKMVERASGLTLGEFMDKNIWKPLGITGATFRILERPDIRDRQAEMTIRTTDADGKAAVGPHPKPYFPEKTSADHGGGGVFTNPRDFFKVLVACVDSSPILLTPASYELLCEPSLSEASAAAFQAFRTASAEAASAAAEKRGTPMAIPAAKRLNVALGGGLNLDDVPGGRSAGTIAWGGLPNLSWTVDRKAGVAMLYASQMLPPGEPLSAWVVRKLEAEIYSGAFFEGAVRLTANE
ncbi:hypothetical protein Sste5346_003319 [Sporothrix stenoceras]|uniref:Beta-lactamase-related domain-containing protein n=1 Tax=Sporothrix stenoceras TaxID=5173 RepID=A0ABR3ZE25_9PEZI